MVETQSSQEGRMYFVDETFLVQGFRIVEYDDEGEVGYVFLYLLRNSHPKPYAFIENLYVHPEYRGAGAATRLHTRAVTFAKNYHCYKIVALSRTDGTRDMVHAWYGRLGYTKYGSEFRMSLA